MDRNLYPFADIRTDGQARADGDLAFDPPEWPASPQLPAEQVITLTPA